MIALRCAHALLHDGWRSNVRLDVGADGRIASCQPDAAPRPGERQLRGWVVPGLPNLHSHAFQRGLVGRTEVAGPEADSFWTWREAMYRLCSTLDLDDLDALAGAVFIEMLEAGYTSVAEFHYLHHQPGGQAYAPLSATTRRLSAVAARVGIGFVALPVLYLRGGFGQAATDRQRRFVHRDVDAFLRLVDDARRGLDADHALGVAAHSLRAVELEALQDMVRGADDLLGAHAPVHIHVAEQRAEVEACRVAYGAGPVEVLLDRFELGPRWCLIHATHASEAALRQVASRGAVVGLCPTTEANLGDGRFPVERFVEAGGVFGVGTDSQASVDAAEELRWLEYQARLDSKHRNRLVTEADGGHVGRSLWGRAAQGGARALGEREARTGLAPGGRADLVELDPEHPRLVGLDPEAGLDGLIFGAARGAIRTVLVRGRAVVEGGVHAMRAEVDDRYRSFARGRETSR